MDHKIFLFGDFEVSLVDLLFDPIGEEIFENSGAYVGNPLFRRLGQLKIGFWEIFVKLGMVVVDHGEDVFDGEAFITIIIGELNHLDH